MITAPGAPVTGLAAGVSTPPRPSPSHQTASDQTIEAASATRTVRRPAMPSPSSNCTAANTALVAIPCCAIKRALHEIGCATSAGLPAAEPASRWLNALVNMADCACRMASSSQSAPSASCSSRRVSGACQAAAGTPLWWPGQSPSGRATATSLITGTPGFPDGLHAIEKA